MARKALPKIAKALTRSTPQLTKGVGRVVKALHRNPQTRHLIRAVPSIARRAVGNIARQAARGGNIPPRTAVRTLAKQARYVLGNPRHRRHALRRHNHLERRFHGRWGRGVARPHYGRARYGAAPQYGTTVHGAAPQYGTVPQYGTTVHGPYQAVPGTPAYAPTYSAGTTPGVRPGTVVAGQCTCPACSTSAATQSTPTAAAAPQYCRSCGQVLR